MEDACYRYQPPSLVGVLSIVTPEKTPFLVSNGYVSLRLKSVNLPFHSETKFTPFYKHL